MAKQQDRQEERHTHNQPNHHHTFVFTDAAIVHTSQITNRITLLSKWWYLWHSNTLLKKCVCNVECISYNNAKWRIYWLCRYICPLVKHAAMITTHKLEKPQKHTKIYPWIAQQSYRVSYCLLCSKAFYMLRINIYFRV